LANPLTSIEAQRARLTRQGPEEYKIGPGRRRSAYLSSNDRMTTGAAGVQ
jgi:hypothetical protein